MIDIDTFNAHDYFLFFDIMSKSRDGIIPLNFDEDTEGTDLVYALLDAGYAKVQVRANGKISSAFLTMSGKAFLGRVGRWVKRDGRKGKVQLKVFEDAGNNNGMTLEKLLETEIDGQAISAAEIHEALDELEEYGAIYIPKGHRNVRDYRLPFQARIREGWITRMENQEPPAWSNLNSRIGSTYNTVDNSQHNTANISGNSQNVQTSFGHNSVQNQTNYTLNTDQSREVQDYFTNLRELLQKTGLEQTQLAALEEETRNAEAEILAAESEEARQTVVSKFMGKFLTAVIATVGAEVGNGLVETVAQLPEFVDSLTM
ncbi:hypothetical protein [Rothia endophytica]|uniref:Uncharacterized protein n=1 Tax=Rothia endophytica TaxID=1324766 RepID=A0ABP9BR82_9MICC